MKKITLTLAAIAAAFTMNAQEVIFEDSFEDYDNFAIENIGGWTLVDEDQSLTYGFQGVDFENEGSAFAFIVFNGTATTPELTSTESSNWEARTGDKAMTSFAATTPTNNDWLISPSITLGNTNNILTFYAKAANADYSNEIFDVAISTTDTQISSFTPILTNQVPTALNYEEFIINLDDYAGETIYIAINHRGNDQFGFQIDDFSVTTDNDLSLNNNYKINLSHFNSNETLTIDSDSNLETLEIYSILGKKVTAEVLNNNNASINIANLQNGVYLAKVSAEGQTKTFKFIKK